MIFKLLKRIAICAAIAATVSSCGTPKNIVYLQNLNPGESVPVAPIKEITAMPDDRLQIYVHSRTTELAAPFNISTRNANNGNSNQRAYYVVDSFGDIEFPMLGTVHIGGLTRQEIAKLIKDKLISQNMLNDPTVIVEFMDHKITVLGDVTHAGIVQFEKDRINVLEAIAMAGDLAITGERYNVKVVRMENGREKAYSIDLCDANSVYSSPVFYLQQNDLIYVEPNNTKKRTANANGNSFMTPGFWMGLFSFLVSTTLLFINLF